MDLRKYLILALTDSLTHSVTGHQNQSGTSNHSSFMKFRLLVEFGTQIKEKFQKPKFYLFQSLK